MAKIETWFNQDLKQAVRVRYIDGNVFSADNNGNIIGVNVFDNGEPATLGGSAAASIIRADGVTVAASGTLSGNQVSVALPQSAYAVPGVISIVLKLTSGTDVTTLLAVVGNVYQSTTDTVVDPGTIIPDINTLVAEIEAAVASIPADYSDLWTSLAPAYSTSGTYAVGQYVTYDGGLYRCTTAITTAESWTAAHWTAVTVGGDLYALNNMLVNLAPAFDSGVSYEVGEYVQRNGELYRFKVAHTGSWNSSDVIQTTMGGELFAQYRTDRDIITYLLRNFATVTVRNIHVPKGSTQKELIAFDVVQGEGITIDFALASASTVKTYLYLMNQAGTNILGSSFGIDAGKTTAHITCTPDADYSGVRLCYTVSNSASADAMVSSVTVSKVHGIISDKVNRDDNALLTYGEQSVNLLDNTHTGWINNATGFTVTFNGDRSDITLTLDAASSSATKYCYNRVDVTGVDNIVVTCDVYGTGRGYIRIGSIDDFGTITWIASNVTLGTAIDVSTYNVVVIALQVTDSGSYAAGAYNMFHNLQVQSGIDATGYEPPFAYVDNKARDQIRQILTPETNLLPLDASKYHVEHCAISIGTDGTIVATCTDDSSWVSLQTPPFDVSQYKYICAGWKNQNSPVTEKRMLRVGSWDGADVTWLGFIEYNGGYIDMTGIRRAVIRLYVNTNSYDAMVAGDVRTYKNLTIQPGTVPKFYPYDTYPYAIPPYYFTGNYLDNRVDTINAKLNACAATGDAFVFITDMHTNGQNEFNSPALIKYVSEYTGINKLFDGGDDTDGAGTRVPMILRRSINGQAHFCTGNHDTFGYTGGDQLYHQYDIPLSDQIGNNFERYYYVDDPQTKFRYIVLSSYTRNTDPETDQAISNLTQAQLDWFTGTALDVPTGWTIVVIAHALYKINLANDNLSLETGAQAFIDAIDGYDGNGKIACVMLGHSHRDRIVYTTHGVPIIITTCDKNKPYVSKTSGATDLNVTRTSGTRYEQAFDVCIVDTSAQTVTAYRIGGNARDGVGNDPGDEVDVRVVSYP